MKLRTLYSQIQSLLLRDDGQDLVEYALAVLLIGLGATAGMRTLASDINTAFSAIGTSLTSLI